MNKHIFRSYVPELLILFLCAVLLLHDIGLKQGYHMDELLSFELANAQFNPWIVPTQPQGRLAKFVENELAGENFGETFSKLVSTVLDVLQNRGDSKLLRYQADVYPEPVWIDSRQFTEYITVGGKDAFNYLSVYFNVKDDNHPPLHFMLLHTVSSVFRGKISPYMGCGINLVFVLGMMILLMWIGRKSMILFGRPQLGRVAGLWAAGWYGLSAGALSTTLLIRMYAMMSFFCVALFAIHLDKLYAPKLGGEGFHKKNKLLILVTVLGFWTQYFFLFYCLILAAVTVVFLWVGNRRREAGRYIGAMITAAVIGVAGFPFAIADVFSSGRGVEALENLSAGLAGYGSRLISFGGIWADRLGEAVLLILLAALVIGMACVVFRASRVAKKKVKLHAGVAGFGCVLVLPVAGYFLLAARMSPYLVDRYIMPLFPFGILIMVLAIVGLSNKKAAIGLMAVTLLLQICIPTRYQNPYFYRDYSKQLAVSEQYASVPCICIGEGVGYYENLLEFTNYEETLILTPQEFEEREDVASIECRERVVVLLKRGLDRDRITEIFAKKYGFQRSMVLQERGGAYGDEILLLER